MGYGEKGRVLLIPAMFIMLFIIFYAGHFLFDRSSDEPSRNESSGQIPEETGSPGNCSEVEEMPAVVYRHIDTEIDGHIQKIHMLEFNAGDERVKLKPVLSFDRIYGYEFLSEMARRHGAYAAVNGGFFYEYGYPSGMVVIDGELITASSGKYPVLVVSNGKAELKEINTEIRLESGKASVRADGINKMGSPGDLIVYTPAYGLDNRAKDENVTAIIEEGVVRDIGRFKGAVEIPGGGMLATIYGKDASEERFGFGIGDKVELVYSPFLGEDAQAYECGSWIVRNGEIVIGDADAWVGVLTNRDPRTAAGIKDDNTVVLITVDGRQPGYSTGMTGKELGRFLLSQGIKNAAMLDGGASTEMIAGGRIVNRPSFKGQERPLAGGIILQVAER